MIFLSVVVYFLSRLIPTFSSPVPVGYDPGLYLYLWHHDLSISWLRTVYPPFIFYLGKFLNIFTSPENYLIPISFAFAALLFLSVYLYTKNKWTIFLLSTSAIQYRLWWWYYIKNVLGLSFVFFYLYFDQKKSKLRYLFPLFLPLLHQPTAIILFLILAFKKDFKSLAVFAASFTAYYLSNYSLTVASYLPGVLSNIGSASGTFYSLPLSLLLMLPYLPLTFFSLRQNKLISAMFLICFFIPFIGFFLSNRFIPFFDIFAIVLAGYTLEKIKNKIFKIPYAIFLVAFIFVFVLKTSAPLINSDEFAEIKLLNTTPVESYILVTDNEYTPWVYGYSNRKPITPGLGEYDIFWSNSEWNQFWSGQGQAELLKKLPQPLFIWSGDKSARNFVGVGECFTRFSWHVWQFNCQTTK